MKTLALVCIGLLALPVAAQGQEIALGDVGPFGLKVTRDGSQVWVPMFGQFWPTFVLGSTVKVVDTASGAVIDSIPVGLQPEELDTTKDGRYAFVTNSGSASVSIIDVEARTVVATTRIGTPFETFLFGVAISPHGKVAVVNTVDGNYDGSEENIVILDADPSSANFGQVIERIEMTGGFTRPAFRPDSDDIVVQPRGFAGNDFSAHPRLCQFDKTELKSEVVIVPAPGGAHGVEDVAVTPNGQYAYVPVFNFDPSQGSDELYVVDLFESRLTDIIRLGSGDVAQHGVAISPDGLLVAVTNFNVGTVSLVFVPTHTVFRTVPVGANPNEISFARDGSCFYVSNQGSGSLSRVEVEPVTQLIRALLSDAFIDPSIEPKIRDLLAGAEADLEDDLPELAQALAENARAGLILIGAPKDPSPPSESLNNVDVPLGGVYGGSGSSGSSSDSGSFSP